MDGECYRRSSFLILFSNGVLKLCEPGSSVSIVSGYGLDDRVIAVRSPAEAEDFSSDLCVDRLWGHPPPVQWLPGVYRFMSFASFVEHS
jgi:hypothetical protein